MDSERSALITGGSRGLGFALARALLERDWNVMITGRDGTRLSAAMQELGHNRKLKTISGDVAAPAHRQKVGEAVRQIGSLNVIVNNASVLGPTPLPPLLEYPVDRLEEVYRVNTIAPLALLQTVRPWLAGDARILNITSDAGVEAYEGWGGYGSSKAGLEQLSAVLAVENPDLRVYWVDPGDMRTAMQQEAFPGEDISDRPLPEESVPGLLTLMTGTLPSGRYQARELNGANGG